ncbi:MAG: translation initiation factor IF-2 [Nitrospirota bacterium]|nr:translation initiation factor IF-2 [Nitrospirota bacterium]
MAQSTRVYELANKLGITSKDLIAELKEIGVEVKNHMAGLEDDVIATIEKRHKGAKSAPAAKAPKEAPKEAKKSAAGKASAAPAAEKKKAEAPAEPKKTVKEKQKEAPSRETAAPAAAPTSQAPSQEAAPPKPSSTEKAPEKPKVTPPVITEEDVEEEVRVDLAAKFREKVEPHSFKKKTKLTAYQFGGKLKKEGGKKWDPGKGGARPHGKQEASVAVLPSMPRKRVIKISEGVSIKEYADRIGQKANDIIRKLFEMGMMATINQPIDLDAAQLIADSYGLKIEIAPILSEEVLLEEEGAGVTETPALPRPPVVTIMGHVDHGKTSLLDAIRQANVTAGEAGGITQHIGAYMVRLNDRDISFLDTPGHEAFTAMRARGAQVTDIVILVVAADDGVMPQTVEAINHAKAAGVPIIVAVNKIDKQGADQEKIKRELSEQGLVSEEWGGDTIFVPVSAKQKIGIESLLEMILLQADVLELKAPAACAAKGIIVEAKLSKGRGPVATVMVQTGTLHPGDIFVAGSQYGRVRALVNDRGEKLRAATPSTPVEVIGLSGVPLAGDTFIVVEDEKKARQVATLREQKIKSIELAKVKRITLDDLHSQIKEGEVKELGIIIKGDVQGSVGAIGEALSKIGTAAVKVRVIHSSVGAITETDVMLASASNAIIIGFNVRPEPKATALAEKEKVDIRAYNIIYDAIADVKAAMEGLLEPTLREKILGRAQVRQVISIPKIGAIAGSYVTDGSISRACTGVRVLRDNVVVYTGKIGSLKRFKDDVREVQSGYECGIGIENFNDIKADDVLEAFMIEKEATKL